jgi:Acyl-CoA carboxylase epsilon subunit
VTDRPFLRIVRGEPTDEELAALIAVVNARAADAGASPHRPRAAWNAPDRLVRKPVVPGRDGWRRSTTPG